MDRKGLEQLIFDTYSVEPDYPWMDTPESAVFRHEANRKWFALVTTVPKSKLGLPGQQPVDIVNLKCDPILIGSLRAEPGFYPAYHMNKENWITAALDGSAPERLSAPCCCCVRRGLRISVRTRCGLPGPSTW